MQRVMHSLNPCSSFVKDTLLHTNHPYIQDILKADCKNVLDIVAIDLFLAGLEKSIENGLTICSGE